MNENRLNNAVQAADGIESPMTAEGMDVERIPPAVRRRFPKVLLVDDSKFLADVMATFFELDGFTARAAYGGEEALQAIGNDVPDLAFIDLVMPDIDGIEVARQVRSKPGKCPVLVALSGWEEDCYRQRARDAGFDHFLAKPLDIPALRKFVIELVADELEVQDDGTLPPSVSRE